MAKIIDLGAHRLEWQTRKLLATLTPREEQILRMLYGIGRKGHACTPEEIGRQFAMTAEDVREVQARALSRLKRYRERVR